MAYFLPSYFQKRLLRYALSRLDFIDNDALNLDNLGFTIGQRSVIELKNVAIKVSKLVEKLDLPAAVLPRTASIGILRITIPADLHASGIEVEVDGIGVEIELDERRAEDAGKYRKGGSNAPSHADIANRPRLSSPGLHDPGGSRLERHRYGLESAHIIPGPEDLAASFLDAEPEREKQELQAVVESRSTYLQTSSPGLESSVSEDGTGLAEGFSLPGFVTNFFAGIADRLSVVLRHIAVSLSISVDSEHPTTEPVRLMLRVEEVELQGLRTDLDAEKNEDIRRQIRAVGIELLVISDADLLPPKSNTVSPKLSRSRSTAAASSRHSSLASSQQRAQAHPGNLQLLDSSSSNSVASSDGAQQGLGADESMLGSQIFSSTLNRSGYASSSESPQVERLSPIRSREADPSIDSPRSASPSSQQSADFHSGDEGLAQSRMFSHDEAESMYMSAMSSGKMPGSFELQSATVQEQEPSSTPRPRTQSATTLRAAEQADTSFQPPTQIQRSTFQSAVQETFLEQEHTVEPPHCAKPILRINEANIKVPVKAPLEGEVDEVEPSSPPRQSLSLRTDRRSITPRSFSHVRLPSEQSVYGGIPQDEKIVKMKNAQTLEISIGDIELLVDTGLCGLLLKASTKASSLMKQAELEPTPDSKPPETQTDRYFQADVKSIVLNVMETVPEVAKLSDPHRPTESTFSVRADDSPLLQLQVLDVRMQMAQKKGRLDQKIVIHRFGLYREADKILTFLDPSALQESFIASSVMLDTDDIVVQQSGERVEINTKPLRIMLDLLVVDDVLSRSGGLSSLLDLGASMASTGTAKDQHLAEAPTRRRSVHFEDTGSGPTAESVSSPGLKLNMRINAAIIDLVGSESSVQIKSSAIKLVHRATGLRTNISSVSIRGPIARNDPPSDTLNIRVGDISLQYRDRPDEQDLDRLLSLLAPSSNKYEEDDDIMVDTLLRQRRKGGILELSVGDVHTTASGLAWTQRLAKIGEEISKLSTVAKYLPEDDRPGLLSLILVKKFAARIELDKQFGPLLFKMNLFEAAHITIPSLMALQISSFGLTRGQNESLVHELVPNMQESTIIGPPMLMCRFIPDEMEPTIKLKLSNTAFEYSVPLLVAITQLIETVKSDLAQTHKSTSPRASEIYSTSSEASDLARKIKFSLAFRSSALSLKPLGSPACGLFLLTDAVISYSTKRDMLFANIEINKASIMIIDDITKIGNGSGSADPKLYFDQNDTLQGLVKVGFVPVGSVSAASADVKINEDRLNARQFIDVEFCNNLLFLETCADSTQTLIQILSGLSPPAPPSKQEKYRTQVVPIEDMLASFTGHAFVSERGPELGMQVDEADSTPTPSTILNATAEGNFPGASDYEQEDDEAYRNDIDVSQVLDVDHDQTTQGPDFSKSLHSGIGGTSVHIAPVNIMADDDASLSGSVMMHTSLIDFRDNHFVHDTSVGGTAHRWDSAQNTYGMGSELAAEQSPLKVRVRDVHIIWNLFDGYDWQNTRDVITQAVRDVEDRALAKQRKRESHRSPGPEEEDESVIGDVLFNSIYISIPKNGDPRDLTNAINIDLGDGASETGSYATSTTITTATSKRHSHPRMKPKKLRLNRSRQHKMTFELEGLAVDLLAFPPDSGEVESSVDIRVRKLDVFDHIPTSTWKKFATYMHESGEREIGTDQVHIELLNVKPIAELAASEMVMKVTVLPLRLHVDQDALDFLTRFFEFKDDRVAPSTAPSNPPFLQRVEFNPIKLRLDFKPKRVDYAGLKSGRTTEFMNFFILDRADMVLRRVILYGVSGFDRLGIMLNNIWTPDVRNNQLPTVLAGLAPVRSLVDVGSGVRDLVAIPIREYKKDGRIVRSIQKGALAFAKTTTTELVNLGAKLAIGTQTVLQNAEDVLAPQNKAKQRLQPPSSDSSDEEQPHAISHYADQPLGIIQGLRGAYASLERDLLLAKDAIVAVPGEIMAEGSATGAVKVVLKNSPTIILRPAIGVTKAMGTALLGAGNTLDKGNRRRIEDKYKRH